MSETTWKPLKGVHAMYQTTWVTAPPVVELAGKQAVVLAASQMLASVKSYDTGEHEEYDDNLDLMQDVEDWNDRVTNAVSILELIIKSGAHDYNLIYRVFGVPAGILCLSDMDPVHVSFLVSHPGVDGAGGTLMELACDWSERRGKGGRLDLHSYDKKSTAAYRAFGFVKSDGDYSDGGTMILDPVNNGVWTKAGPNWKLAKHVAKKYFATRVKPVPRPPVKN